MLGYYLKVLYICSISLISILGGLILHAWWSIKKGDKKK
jgi:hypothetical protein